MQLGFVRNKIVTQAGTFPGSVGVIYSPRLRIRVCAPLKTYEGGVMDGYVSDGGTPASDLYAEVSLVIGSPAKTYYLNAGVSGSPEGLVFLDYMFRPQVEGGTTLTVTIDTKDNLVPVEFALGQPATEFPSYDRPDDFRGVFAKVDYDYLETFPGTTIVKSGGVRGFRMAGWGERLYRQRNEQ